MTLRDDFALTKSLLTILILLGALWLSGCTETTTVDKPCYPGVQVCKGTQIHVCSNDGESFSQVRECRDENLTCWHGECVHPTIPEMMELGLDIYAQPSDVFENGGQDAND